MNIQISTNGNLEMSATKKEQKALKKIQHPGSYKAESEFIEEYLAPLGYTQTYPEKHGYLTSATLITNGKNVWGDMQYAVTSFLETLAAGGQVTWTKG
jgi:hypothetical protein